MKSDSRKLAKQAGEMMVDRNKLDVSQAELFRVQKKLEATDSQTLQEGAKQLSERRDELLQEIMDLQNEISGLETKKETLKESLKHKMTEVVLCEKMIGNFGVLEEKQG